MSRGARGEVLGWSARQAAILTAGGRAEALWKRGGFEILAEELPHHHLEKGTAVAMALKWRKSASWGCDDRAVGAFERRLLAGSGDRTTDADEVVRNLQTPSIFVDLRIPRQRPRAASLETCSDWELRALARQHAFAGYSAFRAEHCVRHHFHDWNYVGTPRTVPNKWRIEGHGSRWTEWSWATDAHGQSYYLEQWQRLEDAADSLALVAEGIVVVVVGDHLNYVRNRRAKLPTRGAFANLADAVDAAVADGRRRDAASLLAFDAGHATRAPDGTWIVDLALQPWHEGEPLFPFLFGSDEAPVFRLDCSSSSSADSIARLALPADGHKLRPGPFTIVEPARVAKDRQAWARQLEALLGATVRVGSSF